MSGSTEAEALVSWFLRAEKGRTCAGLYMTMRGPNRRRRRPAAEKLMIGEAPKTLEIVSSACRALYGHARIGDGEQINSPDVCLYLCKGWLCGKELVHSACIEAFTNYGFERFYFSLVVP
jgi:hypothetical protein